jgi:hypothetical protein
MSISVPSLVGAWLLAAVLSSAALSSGSEKGGEVLPTVEEILEKARAVNARYPWILLSDRGLTLTAYDLPREEFLRGLSEATELVFSGTEELPETITLIVHSARADQVFQEIRRLDPFLISEERWSEKRVIFRKVDNPTVGLSEEELIARYRRPRPSLNSIRSDRGAFAPGALISEGTRFPNPLNLEILPDRSVKKVFLLCNQIILKEFPFKDPGEIDLELYQAQSQADRMKAVREKLSQIHHEVSRFPMSSTAELLEGMARAAAFLHPVAGTVVVRNSLIVRMREGSEMEWELPRGGDHLYWSEPEAIQAAYAFQNQLNFELSRGAVVLISEQFGDTVIENGFDFFRRTDEIAANGRWSLAEKELEMRKEWRDQAEPVLEYFYTSVVSSGEEGLTTGTEPARVPYGATTGIGIPPNIKEFLRSPAPLPLGDKRPLLPPAPLPAEPLPDPAPPLDLPAPAPLEGVGLESLIDPRAEAAEDLFPAQE